MTVLGVISDTHGLLRPEAVAALGGVAQILHAGDIGSPEVVAGLLALAPVTAVRGNCDRDAWAQAYPLREELCVARVSILMLHDLHALKARPPGVQVVISGHSHRPLIEEREGCLYLNPGSAGPRRFKLPVTLALLKLENGRAAAEIIYLGPG